MISQTANAASSIAYRNVVNAVIPKALWNDIYAGCRRLAAGEGKSIEQGRANVLAWIKEIGVTPAELFRFLAVEGIADVNLSHMEMLAGIRTSLAENMTTIEEVFRPTEPNETEQKAQSTLKDKLAARMDKPNGNGNGHATPPFDVKESAKTPADELADVAATARAVTTAAVQSAVNATATPKPAAPPKSEYRLWLESELDQHNTAVKGVDPQTADITVYQANNAIVRTGTETSVIEKAHVTKNGKSDPERVVATLEQFWKDDRDWVKATLGAYLSKKIEELAGK